MPLLQRTAGWCEAAGRTGENHLPSCPLIPLGAVGENGLLPLQRTAFGPYGPMRRAARQEQQEWYRGGYAFVSLSEETKAFCYPCAEDQKKQAGRKRLLP